jgi:proteasome accessory factor B
MAGQSPLVRQWILLRLLSSRRFGLTVREAAEELGTHQKTIRRDLSCFQAAGFPLEEIAQGHGRKAWRLSASPREAELSFAYDEALALYLGRRFLEPLAGTPFWAASQAAMRKIRAVLGDGAAEYAEGFSRFFHHTQTGAGDYSKKADVIDALMVGIEDRKAVFITYRSLQATEPTTYDCYPYGLIYHRGSLYLVGHAPDRNEVRHWKVDRIEQAEVTKFPFSRPGGFDLQSHLRGAFGVFHGDGDIFVKIRFAPTVARYVQESRWHESQQLARQKDGSLLAGFRLSSTEEIKHWVLSFGRHAEVLEPRELREEIVEELRVLLGLMVPQPVEVHRVQESRLCRSRSDARQRTANRGSQSPEVTHTAIKRQ